MGYEIAGAWGARMARPDGDVVCFVGDGSYLMLNSELYSSVITGQKLIVIVCDNGGFAVIDRLQTGHGRPRRSTTCSARSATSASRSTGSAHAASLGCIGESVTTIEELEDAFERARAADRTTVIAIETAPDRWTSGGAFWEVGVAEVAERPEVAAAREGVREGKKRQRVGW